MTGQNQLEQNKGENRMKTTYMVRQLVLKEKLVGTGSNGATLTKLEEYINKQAKAGWRLHTISTVSSGSTGLLGGDRIQATMVFEKEEG